MADGAISSAVFETWTFIKDRSSAYSSFLYRWFRFRGITLFALDLVSTGLSCLVGACFAIYGFALPHWTGEGDIWNRNRPVAITFTDANGTLIGRRGIRQDDAIPLDDIPKPLINAVLATEDARFYDHIGLDFIGTVRAAVHNTRGGSKQGGSSITQQVVKNLLLTPERTFRRKMNEAVLALWVEERLSKNEILKLYLDRSYLGGGAYGVEAASQFYFGKSVRDINLSEAAVLAGLFKAPTQYAPHTNPEASRARTNVVLYRMLDAGFITQGELLDAQRHPAQVVSRNETASPDWYLDWAYQNTLEVLDRQNLKNDFVMEVKTTIDLRLQNASQAILNDIIDNLGPSEKFTQAASITMAPDGAVRAIIGGRDYGDSQFNRATVARRQVGSSFKPFVYLTALEHGFTRDTVVEDSPVCVGNWCPHNFEPEYRGSIRLWQALTHSVNTIAVKLMLAVGRKQVEATAVRLGVNSPIDQYPTMAIGTSALTLMDMTSAYSTLAAGGRLAKPYAVMEIRKPTGELLYSHAINEKDAPQVDPYDKVAELDGMMHEVVMQGTARRAQLGYAPVAGKTGTNANFRDAWFVGFSAHNVTGVWVGNDDNSSMDSSKGNAVTGGHIPAPTWKRIMDVAEFGLKPAAIPGAPLVGYGPPLTALNDPALAALGLTFGPQAPVKPTTSSVPDSEAAPTPENTSEADPASRNVLNNMLDLVDNGGSPGLVHDTDSGKRLRLVKAKHHEAAKTRSLFDFLFNRH